MRNVPPALASFLNSRPAQMWTADLFTITLVTGEVLRWTSTDIPVIFGGNTWLNIGPKLTRTKWEVKNTIDIPEMDIILSSTGADFNSTAATSSQIALNPAATSGGVLSNSNTTFTGAGTSGLSLALFAAQQGKYYFEFSVTGDSLDFLGCGLCLGSATAAQLQNNGVNGAIAIWLSGSVWQVYINGALINTGVNVQGTTSIAVDLSAQKFWVRPNPTAGWLLSGNPSTGAGGATMQFPGLPLYPFALTSKSGQSVTVNFGSSPLIGSVPTGFAPGWPFIPSITGSNIKTLMAQGLLDGAIWELDRAFGVPVLGNGASPVVIGTVNLFTGRQGQLDIGAINTKVTIRAVSVLLQQYMPKNRYFLSCIHSFCDAGCTLSLQSFTATNTVGVGPNTGTSLTQVANWLLPSGNSPTITQLIGGTLSVLSGIGQGQSRTVVGGSVGPSGGSLVLSYPLDTIPAAGDLLSCTQGCDKTLNTCTTTYSNQQNYRGFPYVPPAESGL